MNILAIDTAAEILAVAVRTEAGVFGFEADAGTRHSELLFGAVDAVLASAGLEREALGLFACMKGPGSFTGLRIGFAAVKGMALALGKPTAAVPTLDCLAYPFADAPLLCVPALDAKRNRFYTALFRGGRRLSDYSDCTAAELAALIARDLASAPSAAGGGGGRPLVQLAGSGALSARDALRPLLPGVTLLAEGFRHGNAAAMLRYIAERETEAASAPLYIRSSDAEEKRLQ
jgi:tRNA threonylcarbamoyladenosine biosynthesis protein TsaB